MSKVITKREALQMCIDGWLWQAKHSSERFKANNPIFKSIINACPCCEYRRTHIQDYCGKTCLLSWPEEDCVSDSSPYTKWHWYSNTDEEREKYALQIVKLAREALREVK